MSRWLTTIWTGVALLACGAAQARPFISDAAVENAFLKSALEMPQVSEVQAIYLASDVAKRKDRRLTLTFANGTTRIFENRRACGPNPAAAACTRHFLVVYLRSRSLFVLATFRGEAASYLLIDGSKGAETAIGAKVQLAPNGRRVLVFDPEKDSLATILRRERGRFVHEWSGRFATPQGEVASLAFAGWPSDDVALFRKTMWKRSSDPAFTSVWSKVFPSLVETVVELGRTGNTWQYRDQPPSSKTSASPQLRWNWRTARLSAAQGARIDATGEELGVADVVFGRSTVMIDFEGFQVAGKIATDGTITGVVVTGSDGEAALVVGQHREMRWPGLGPECALEEIILRDGLSMKDVLPNGTVTILVKQRSEECFRGMNKDDNE